MRSGAGCDLGYGQIRGEERVAQPEARRTCSDPSGKVCRVDATYR